jgi:predicted nucleic acid-binding protein
MQTPPRWISVQVAPRLNDSRLAELDPGERQAIALALEHGLSLILMDETKGRLKATSLKLRVRGTLGILEEAARRGEIDFMSALQKLEATTFRMTPSVREAAVRRAGS